MRYAIVSDLHSNRPAWTAVLDDIAREGVDAICCLGDIIGYGPRPRFVLASVRAHCENVVLGNHDAAVTGAISPGAFNSVARAAIEWTAARLDQDDRAFLAGRPLTLRGDGMLLTHGDASQPARFHYVTTPEEARDSFRASKRDIIFFGHTHEPGVFTCGRGGKTINKLPARDISLTPGARYMINPGSVGDPRCPRDLRASYCLFDSKLLQVKFRRVEFDVEEYRRDFEASGLQHKPFFLRVLDADTIHGPEECQTVSDHKRSVDVGVEEDRRARLVIAGAPLPQGDQTRALALAEAARKSHQRSKAGLLVTLFILAACGLALFLHLANEKSRVAGDESESSSRGKDGKAHGATSVTTSSPALRTGDDLRNIMADGGWEDPNDSKNSQ